MSTKTTRPSLWQKLKPNKVLDTRALLVFERLIRFYNIFNLLTALIAGLSLAVLSFSEFHPHTTSISCSAEAFLTSSAMSGVVAAMLATMLLFRFEGHDAPTRKHLAIAWTPLILLDWAIVEFLVGLILWYAGKNDEWRTSLVAMNLVILLALTVWTAVWMWQEMSRKGGLGAEELKKTSSATRTADS